jgi:hypothetical protein
MFGRLWIFSRLRSSRWWRVAARLVACCVTAPLLVLSSAAGAWAEPSPDPDINVTPSWGGAPGWDKVQQLLNFGAQAGFVCCLALVLIGGAAMGVSKLTGSSAAGNKGIGLLAAGGGGVLITRFAPAIVTWLRN